jgi:hypothetical protein
MLPQPYDPRMNQSQPMAQQNPFGVNTPLPAPLPVTQGGSFSARPPEPQAPDYVKNYNEVLGNRPAKLAYQQAVDEGAPQINRSKWARLAMALAAGGVTAGTGDPVAGYNLGRSALEAPQIKANQRYKEKMEGLGNLANMEESDVNARLKSLEAQRSDYFKTREDTRQQEELGIRRAGEERAKGEAASQAKLRDAQVTNMALDNMIPIKETDGNTYLYDKGTKTKTLVGKTDDTDEEAFNKAKKTFSMQEGVRGYYDRLHDERQAASSMATTKANVEGRADVAMKNNDAKRDVAVARLRERAAGLKPDDVSKNISLDLADAIAKEELPPDAVGYLQFEDNGTPVAKKPWFGDDKLELAVRDFIGRSITKSRTPATGVVGGRGGNPPVDPAGLFGGR